MANQRPIRRAPTPRWRRGKGRPVKWLAASYVETECLIAGYDVPCEPVTPAELIVGELDFPQVDRNNVRIDRMVGTVSFLERVQRNGQTPAPTIVRFGILAVEDSNRVYQSIDLWDQESVEEFEWMWFQQFTFPHNDLHADEAPIFATVTTRDIPLDIRTRRSIGQKDSIVMYAQRRTWTTINANNIEDVTYVHNLRVIART